jgi:DNA polymerase III alpha subunit
VPISAFTAEHSLLDGACKTDELAERAASFGQPALSPPTTGVMNGEQLGRR